MSEHGLTKENMVGTLPPALRTDPSVVALAEALAGVLAERPREIDRLLIYPAIDTLDEPLLDILAYDFKVDWWDPEYSLEEKRRTLKSSWRVHRLMGTKAAVESALGAVFPGANVKEWFEYGGTPYCFRIDLPMLESGVTAERQRRVLSRVLYYKNLRSHLESVNLQAESTGSLEIGACTTAGVRIEIWPELATRVELTGRANMGAVATVRQTVSIYPELPTQVEIIGQAATKALTAAQQIVEVYPELTQRVEIAAEDGIGALAAAHQTMEVFPELTTKVEANTSAGAGSIIATRQTVEIYPE